MINPTAAPAAGTGSGLGPRLRPVLRGIAGVLLAALAPGPDRRRQPGAAAPDPAGPAPQRQGSGAAAGPERPARGRHHPGHPEAHPHRRAGVHGRGRRSSRSRCRTWWRPTWSARACSSRSIAPPSSTARATSTRPRASRTGASSTPRRWWSAGPARSPDGRVVGEFRLWDVLSGRQLASPALRGRRRRTGAGSAISSPTRSISA